MWLAWAAGVTSIVYLLRRHRVDDYRGRYRSWIWLSIALLIASMESVANLHVALADWLCQVGGIRSHIEPTTFWLIAIGTLGAGVACRTGIEMRRSLGACMALGAATCGYGTLICLSLFDVFPLCTLRVMVHSSLLLSAHLLVLLSALLYARYVYLDAHGQLAPRRARQARKQSVSAQEEPTKKEQGKKEPAKKEQAGETTVEEPGPPKPATRREPAPAPAAALAKTPGSVTAPATLTSNSSAAKNASAQRAAATADDLSDSHKLSKADRKRLKKEMRRQLTSSD
jgi:hypothetical protein